MAIKRREWMLGTLGGVIGGGLLSASGASAADAAWPSKPIKIIVPYPPGGSSDIIARSITQPLSEALKQTVLVENRSGANGNLGADFVAKSAPDGYTLLLCDVGALAISPSVYAKLAFDPSKDLSGVTMLAYSPHLLVVHPSVPANNLKELVALSKKSDLNFAVTATGSAPHLAGVALERAVGARWQYVPYKGGVQAIQDTVGGQTQILMNGMLATLPQVQSGKLKILGVSKATRMPLIGDVPTIAEQGVPGYESGTWQGVLVSRGTPDAIVQRLNKELVSIIRSADIRSRLAGQGAEVVTMTSVDQDKFFNKERARWAKVVTDANIKID
ncbi:MULTISPECIES: Bug family tripartite tricarboxylate transporter substrate binding protein [unclassified Variovorax]|uniref:Bug family tripartite tricarboxylate transporter substrate binding protein n=1 Tax=unclassified Variovorax TaxID=663243 RepID=UPI00164DD03B|nr:MULTISPECIES: tripartite tricarboxylate transporter substrate binding protein [unclassified Variovorax]MEB0058885.1 tripartite tricarboxylate transporter substrate binding protein [Variovorax sp. LG9.2]MEB0114080.1 tripartite tricarboxylate transporter substrate binding protein [Variovorax sp. RTB1]QNK72080.1 tripartite tricarboxylate transporter substrate binding protein [Variovorax sp. PAMC28562]